MKKPLFTALVLAGVIGLPAASFAGPQITVSGSDDTSLDRPAIQQAIDSAQPGDTILLEGTFRLDGAPVTIGKPIRLRGVALDNDGDGLVNEDWADGLDSDGDGLVDEDDWDATLFGIVDAFGVPVPETDRTVVFNRAIFVRGLDAPLAGLSIEDLRFSGHFRAITLEPDTGSTGGTVCENLFPTAGYLDGVRLLRNRFDGNDRGLEFEGAAVDAQIRDNVLESSGIALIVEGGTMGCPLIGGGFSTVQIGQPVDTILEGNLVLDSLTLDAFVFGSDGTVLKDNVIRGAGILSEGDERLEIKNNSISDAAFAIIVSGPVTTGSIKDNSIEGTFFGILLDFFAEGWDVRNNDFSGVELFEVFIDSTATANTVRVTADDRVLDLGTGNTIIVE